MAVWWKTVMAVAVMVVPGAFVVFLAYVLSRTLVTRWQSAHKAAPDRRVRLVRDVFAEIKMRDLVREARAAF